MGFGDKVIKRGSGFHNTGTTVPTADYGGVSREGTRRSFADQGAADGNIRSRRSGGEGLFVLVRNVGALPLMPKRLVVWASGYIGKRVDGYGYVPGERVAGVVDEFFTASGVPKGELFWLQVKGPCLCKLPFPEVTEALFSAGDRLVCSTAATSQGKTQHIGGGIEKQSVTVGTSGAAAHNMIHNVIGIALTARSSVNTNTDTLVNLDLWAP